MWQWGVLLLGVGFFLLSLVACYILLNLTRSLRTVEAILAVTLDEVKVALPEMRHSVVQIDDMVTSVNEKFMAADRAVDATGAAITGWRDRLRERFDGLSAWTRSRGGKKENSV
ncbi:MAG TPA: hypothetical protein VET65_06260 [Candidatus Limnocylindrales bacterium]|nr:hypothetical protein [Candidatus Limnocylindrales bacterium]